MFFHLTATDIQSCMAASTVRSCSWRDGVKRWDCVKRRRGSREKVIRVGISEEEREAELMRVEGECERTVVKEEIECDRRRVKDERECYRTVDEREGDQTAVESECDQRREDDRTVVDDERECDRRRGEVLVAASVTVVLGVANRVLYKLALVPLKHYPFFLAQFATFGSMEDIIIISTGGAGQMGLCSVEYVLVYFSILYIRYRSGIVTEDMLSLPKGPYVVVGLLEALGAASRIAAGAILSGAAIPILSQSFLVWQILFSYIFLGRSYRFNQLLGCFMVALGVIITVASGSGAGSLMEAGIFWSLLMIVSFAFQAADTVLKEIIFSDSSRQLKGPTVDLFVINSYGSAFQALFICLLLPFLSKLWGIPFNQLPSYLINGAGCFLNNGSIAGCEGAPLLPLLFVIVNMGFNVSLLYLLKISSAVVSCLASTVSVPISVLLFTLPLPYLGIASSLPSGFVAGAMVLFLGMLIYSWSPRHFQWLPRSTKP